MVLALMFFFLRKRKLRVIEEDVQPQMQSERMRLEEPQDRAEKSVRQVVVRQQQPVVVGPVQYHTGVVAPPPTPIQYRVREVLPMQAKQPSPPASRQPSPPSVIYPQPYPYNQP